MKRMTILNDIIEHLTGLKYAFERRNIMPPPLLLMPRREFDRLVAEMTYQLHTVQRAPAGEIEIAGFKFVPFDPAI